jgi:hypothetical protein
MWLEVREGKDFMKNEMAKFIVSVTAEVRLWTTVSTEFSFNSPDRWDSKECYQVRKLEKVAFSVITLGWRRDARTE